MNSRNLGPLSAIAAVFSFLVIVGYGPADAHGLPYSLDCTMPVGQPTEQASVPHARSTARHVDLARTLEPSDYQKLLADHQRMRHRPEFLAELQRIAASC